MLDEKELDENLEEQEESSEEEVQSGVTAGLVDNDISGIFRTSFLDYAMSVIVARALPDARDGLKPVHRRIVFGMNVAGVTPDKPHVKCARIVGDVISPTR